MAFSLPANVLPIAFQLLGVVSGLVQDAEAAFDGKPGSGAKKKAFVMKAVTGLLETQNLVKVDLMTPAQEAEALDAADKIVEAVVAVLNLTATFKATQTKV